MWWKLQGIVQSIESSGVLVSITDHICGLCPLMHLADVKLKNPERKFKEKKMMKFRVSCIYGGETYVSQG